MSLNESLEEQPARAGRPSSAKIRRTQAERTHETRTRILNAAVAVLNRKGYAQFRTADVAKAAGVSRGAQLHHFATKEKLVFATMEHVFNKVKETSERRAAALRKGEDPLERIIADAREFFFSDSFFIALDIGTSLSGARLRRKHMIMVREARLLAEQAWLRALMASGLSESEADDLLWLTLALVRGLAVRMLWQNEPKRFDRLLALWRGIVQDHISRTRKNGRHQGR